MLKNNRMMSLAFIFASVLTYSSMSVAKLYDKIQEKGTEHNVEIRMLLKEGVPSANIDVHVDHKTIQLAGFVDNKTQYRNVAKVANKYKDKYKVINNVKILEPKGDSYDEERLAENLRNELKEHKYPVESIDIQVRNGHVILSGFVDKNLSLKTIRSLSESVPGVSEVDNYLLYKQS